MKYQYFSPSIRVMRSSLLEDLAQMDIGGSTGSSGITSGDAKESVPDDGDATEDYGVWED